MHNFNEPSSNSKCHAVAICGISALSDSPHFVVISARFFSGKDIPAKSGLAGTSIIGVVPIPTAEVGKCWCEKIHDWLINMLADEDVRLILIDDYREAMKSEDGRCDFYFEAQECGTLDDSGIVKVQSSAAWDADLNPYRPLSSDPPNPKPR